MSKFGDLVNSKIPVLLDFYTDIDSSVNHTLQQVANRLGDKAKVIKIDATKNKKLSKALGIKVHPTYLVYKNSEMKWRQSGMQDADTLVALVQQFV